MFRYDKERAVADLGEIYDDLRREISDLVTGLTDEELALPVPGTPGWDVKDIVCHLTGDVASVLAADFPREFFESFGDAAAIGLLNAWTARQVDERKDRPLKETLDEWAELSARVVPMMSGVQPWPGDVPPFADRVLLTDAAVHRQDLFGAFGIVRARESVPVKIAVAGYIAMVGFRLAADGVPPLRFVAGDKQWVAGGDDAEASVTTTRFELFRALSGRRSPDQVRAYDWTGDPDTYMRYFFPYGTRPEALIE